MKYPQELHVVARQVGSAYPLCEFAAILQRHGFSVRSFTYELATPVFEKYKLKPHSIRNAEDYLDLKITPNLLLTGTSEHNLDDRKYWQWANELGIASLAWVDQPINMNLRFGNGQVSKFLPTAVLANDKITKQALLDFNIKTSVALFGSPYLAKLKTHTRRKNTGFTAIFVTEPVLDGYKDVNGFDDIDSFLLAYEFFSQLKAQNHEWSLLIKLHPRDTEERFRTEVEKRIPRHLNIQYEISSLDKDGVLETADIVLGMRSMLLFESASIGIPTISFQPNRKTQFPFIDEQPNLLLYTDNNFELQKLEKFMIERPAANQIEFDESGFLNFAREKTQLQK